MERISNIVNKFNTSNNQKNQSIKKIISNGIKEYYYEGELFTSGVFVKPINNFIIDIETFKKLDYLERLICVIHEFKDKLNVKSQSDCNSDNPDIIRDKVFKELLNFVNKQKQNINNKNTDNITLGAEVLYKSIKDDIHIYNRFLAYFKKSTIRYIGTGGINTVIGSLPFGSENNGYVKKMPKRIGRYNYEVAMIKLSSIYAKLKKYPDLKKFLAFEIPYTYQYNTSTKLDEVTCFLAPKVKNISTNFIRVEHVVDFLNNLQNLIIDVDIIPNDIKPDNISYDGERLVIIDLSDMYLEGFGTGSILSDPHTIEFLPFGYFGAISEDNFKESKFYKVYNSPISDGNLIKLLTKNKYSAQDDEFKIKYPINYDKTSKKYQLYKDGKVIDAEYNNGISLNEKQHLLDYANYGMRIQHYMLAKVFKQYNYSISRNYIYSETNKERVSVLLNNCAKNPLKKSFVIHYKDKNDSVGHELHYWNQADEIKSRYFATYGEAIRFVDYSTSDELNLLEPNKGFIRKACSIYAAILTMIKFSGMNLKTIKDSESLRDNLQKFNGEYIDQIVEFMESLINAQFSTLFKLEFVKNFLYNATEPLKPLGLIFSMKW